MLPGDPVVNLAALAIFIMLFWAVGLHHFKKHTDLKGVERFFQYNDLYTAIKGVIKSHEGIQLIILIAIAVAMVT